MTGAQNWQALAAAASARRAELRLPVDLRRYGGPSEMTVRKIEAAAPGALAAQTKTRLETALRWPFGAVERLLAGAVTEEEIMSTDVANDASDVRNWQALAEAVQRRRTRLGLNQEALAARGGPSGRTVRDIEQATQTRYTAKTLRDLEQALGWRPGLVEEVLAGTATEGEIMPTNDAAASAAPELAARRTIRLEVCDELDAIRRMILDDVNEGRMSVGRAAELIARIEDQAARLKGAPEGPDELQERTQP